MAEASFLKILARHKTVGIDTSPFIYHFENDPPTYSGLTTRLFEQLRRAASRL